MLTQQTVTGRKK